MVPGRGEVGLWSPAGWLGRGGGPAVLHPGAAQRCVDARAPCQTHEVRRSGHLPSWSSGTTPAGGTAADGLFLQPRSLTRVAQKVGRGAPRGAVGLGSSPGTSVSVVLPPVTPVSGAAWECTASGHRRLGRGMLGGAPTAPPAAAAPGPGQSGSSGRTGWGWEPLSAAAVSSAVAGLRSRRAEGKASGFDPARRGGGTSACAHGARAPPRAPEVCSLILFLRENPRTSCGPRQIKIPKYSSCRLGNGISAPPGRAEPVPAATPSTLGDVLSVGEQAGAWPAGPPGGVRSRHLRRLPTGSLEGCVFCWICKPRACVWVCGDFSSQAGSQSP